VALCGQRQTEVDEVADEQEPRPDIDVGAVFEAAHPAGQQDLREKDDRGACNPDDEGGASHAPHRAVLAREQGAHAREKVRA
jgi:hypothetical protein